MILAGSEILGLWLACFLWFFDLNDNWLLDVITEKDEFMLVLLVVFVHFQHHLSVD